MTANDFIYIFRVATPFHLYRVANFLHRIADKLSLS